MLEPEQEAILSTESLHKRYKDIVAVDCVSFNVIRGRCTGLLGPNGAGKTTTVEMLEGVLRPSAGKIYFKGNLLDSSYRQQMGIQFQTTALQDFLTVEETLDLFSGLYEKTVDRGELIRLCALADFLERDVRKLSGGQRQRLLLAIALIGDPEILFLDEPTTGLDPQARRNFWSLIKEIKAKGKTVLLTTHYMEEAYELCDTIIIMDEGRIIANGSPEQLLREHFSDRIVELPSEDLGDARLPESLLVLTKDSSVEISTKDVNEVLGLLIDQGVELDRMTVRARTLEDLFLELTGSTLRS